MKQQKDKEGKIIRLIGATALSCQHIDWSAPGGRQHRKGMLMTNQQEDDDVSWKAITRCIKGRLEKSH